MSSCKDDVPRDQIKAALYPIPQRAGSSTENRPLTRAGDQHKMRKTRGAATDSAAHYTLLDTGVDRIHGLAVTARGHASWHRTSQQRRAKTREGSICGQLAGPNRSTSRFKYQIDSTPVILRDESTNHTHASCMQLFDLHTPPPCKCFFLCDGSKSSVNPCSSLSPPCMRGNYRGWRWCQLSSVPSANSRTKTLKSDIREASDASLAPNLAGPWLFSFLLFQRLNREQAVPACSCPQCSSTGCPFDRFDSIQSYREWIEILPVNILIHPRACVCLLSFPSPKIPH